eukprot:3134562-Rhodomonas_salina.2
MPVPNSAAKAPALISPATPASRLNSPALLGGPAATLSAGPTPTSLHAVRYASPVQTVHRSYVAPEIPAQPVYATPISPRIISPVSPIMPLRVTSNAEMKEFQASTIYEIGIQVSELPPHTVERVANTQDSHGAAHVALGQVQLGDEVVAINDEDISMVEMSRVPHLVLGVFGSRAKYTLKRQLMIYELEAERLIPAQMFKM